MTKIFPIVTLLACLATGYAFADDVEPALPSDSRIKLLNYDEGDVYAISAKYGYETNIVFSTGEEIQTVSVGDRSLWQLIPAGNRLFIRPMDENISTNMTVLTNKHSYQFDLKSIGEAKGGNIYVAKFVYPEDKPVPPPAPAVQTAPAAWQEPVHAYQPEPALTPPPPPIAPLAEEPDTGKPYLNYRYTYSGPDDLAPLQVYDDGKTTFIKYRDIGQPLPNVYTVVNGTETLAPYAVKDGLMTVDAIAPEMTLKNSDGTIHIYNETLK